MIVPNIIIFWPGTVATIPAGFVRETTLDGKFPKATADATNPNVTGGSATHTHTSPAHTHNVASHTHTGNLDSANEIDDRTSSGGPSQRSMACAHTHTFTSNGPSAGTTNGTAVTYGAMSSSPPYHELIAIKSQGYHFVPNSAIVLWGTSATAPGGFQDCDGTNSTPDLRNKYIKCASTSADGGGTGGTYTHTHDISHTHGVNGHTHSATSNSASDYCSRNSGGSDPSNRSIDSSTGHAHSFTLASATQDITAHSGSLVTAETVEPAYKKVRALQNTSGSNKLPKGVIAMWLGSLATIPVGWRLCDGTHGTIDLRDKFIKIANTAGEVGNTGGSNTHTHGAQSHSHTGTTGHVHTSVTGMSAHGSLENPTGGGDHIDNKDWTHSLSGNTSSTLAGYDSSSTTADSSDNQPEYRTVAYIQFEFSLGSALLAMLL